jgi:hypothetical protein
MALDGVTVSLEPDSGDGPFYMDDKEARPRPRVFLPVEA